MTKLMSGEAIIVVEFGLEWRDVSGSWQHEIFPYPGELRKKREAVEAQGATNVSEHMRDRRVEFSPWTRTDRRSNPQA